jgi:peptidoglycan hydrolase CwlO-like protein
MLRHRVPALLSLLALLGACAVALAPSSGAQDLGTLRDRADRKRAAEGSLASDVARLSRLATRLQAQIAVVERRRADVQSELAQDRAKLGSIRGALRSERARSLRLREHLHETQGVLSRRLVQLYKTPEADLVGVVLNANDFSDLVDQATFVQRIGDQDRRIIENVRDARAEARAGVRRLAADERRQADITSAIQARSTALAAMSASLDARRAAYAQARAARAAALTATRGDRKRLEREIGRIQARQASLAGASSGGPWAIPWAIVQCESGGQNLPPNFAGASGYYQFMVATWRGLGGYTPQAYQASKAEQDRLAARLWNGGRGASNWVCASLVG